MAPRVVALALFFGETSGLFLRESAGSLVVGSPGNANCPCVNLESGVTGSTFPVGKEKNGTEVNYVKTTGSSCEAWDEQVTDESYSCKKDSPPSWCSKKWCWVDPCTCKLDTPPKRSSYFPKAKVNGRPIYYSYATCGAEDTFTASGHRGACPNQDTEAKCLALKDADDKVACGWIKEDKMCVGKDLVGDCK